MNNRIHILNELQKLAPGLVHLPTAMPYVVPQGYFETLAVNLLTIIKTGDFALPFLPKDKKMPYAVPQGYFDNLAFEIIGKVSMKQTVPEGYFDALPTLLLNKVRSLEVTQELETIAPLLNTISKKPVQAVPENYFENLQPSVEKQHAQQTTVISIKKKLGWAKYAAAASIVLILSFGAYKFFDKTGDPKYPEVTSEQLKTFDKDLAQLDNATIETYLQENESVTEMNADWYKSSQNDDIEYLLQDFTDQELQQQLKENSDLSATVKQKKT